MRIHLSILASCLVIGQCFSQRNEIGIAVASSNIYNTNESARDSSSSSKMHNVAIQEVLTLNHVNSKGTDFFAHLGFFYMPMSVVNRSSSEAAGNYGVNHSNGLRKSAYLKLGLARRYQVGSLTLIAGVNASFEYLFYSHYRYYYAYYENNELTSSNETFDTRAPAYNLVLNLQQSVYYPLGKKFLIGMDLNLGVQMNLTNGDRIYDVVSINLQSQVSDRKRTIYHSDLSSTINLNFNPAVSLRYILK
jgi:hypothetical protein